MRDIAREGGRDKRERERGKRDIERKSERERHREREINGEIKPSSPVYTKLCCEIIS